MQTPDGVIQAADGRFIPVDWLAAIITPSFPLAHGAHGGGCDARYGMPSVAACGAWHLLRDERHPAARQMFSLSLWLLVVMTPVQIVLGDLHGENTRDHQPIKLAAMEEHGIRRRGAGEPMRLFAVPDMAQRRNHWEVAIPDIGSLYLRHNLTGRIHNLNHYPPEDLPPRVPGVFWLFRIMVGLGLLMLAAGIAGLVVRLRGRLWRARWLQWSMVLMAPAGFTAMLAG